MPCCTCTTDKCSLMPKFAGTNKPGLGSDRLQLELQWSRARDNPLPPPPTHGKTPADKATATVTAQAASPPPEPAYGKLYNPFVVNALRSGLPPEVAQRQLRGWPVLHNQPLSQLRWVGSLSRPDQRQGLLAFNGLVYSVHKGDHLGHVQTSKLLVGLVAGELDTQGLGLLMDNVHARHFAVHQRAVEVKNQRLQAR